MKHFHKEIRVSWHWQPVWRFWLTLVAALEVSKSVLEPIPCLNPPKELATSLAGIQGRTHLKVEVISILLIVALVCKSCQRAGPRKPQKQAMLIFRLKQTYDGITKQSFCHWNAKNRLDSYLTRSIFNNQSTFWAVSPGNSYSWHLRNLHRNYFEQRKAFCTHPIYIANT